MTARSMLPLDPTLVAPWTLGDGPRGALLLHGFAGSPPELRRLGEHLAANRWRCSAPALAGHGTRAEDLSGTDASDWIRSAQSALDELSSQCETVVIAGQSMGATMALHLAATNPHVRAMASLAGAIWIRGAGRYALPLVHRVYRWHVPRRSSDLYWPAGVEEVHSYGRRSTRAIVELFRLMRLVRWELPMVRQPVLILHGARDRVVDPRNASDIARRLVCAAYVERHVYPRSGHTISIDIDRDDVNRRVLAWFDGAVPRATDGQ